MELEKEIANLNQVINDLRNEFTDNQSLLNKKISEINLDYQTQLDKEKNEYKLLQEKNELLIKKYESKISDINKEHQSEIEQLESKIVKTLNRKEETITRLNNEVMIKNQTIKKYEELLNKQRNDFISKLNN